MSRAGSPRKRSLTGGMVGRPRPTATSPNRWQRTENGYVAEALGGASVDGADDRSLRLLTTRQQFVRFPIEAYRFFAIAHKIRVGRDHVEGALERRVGQPEARANIGECVLCAEGGDRFEGVKEFDATARNE